ncbi:TonB-dependent receptor [Sphingomonas cavernae]|uniref:TonB-dependent receptor n=1 Tax=Sphingomonas cavernae TaxID=2320861 RepID=A0A418WQX1_9SPHN|nr:TonB-dependent receptor [Sphingomonas cavernae]RJF93664.1 TonB-dependent receptor [Sphingomonas cavernae]
MNRNGLFLTVASLALLSPAMAQAASADSELETASEAAAESGTDARGQGTARKEVFSTGVAKGRDILDSAISTSSLKSDEIEKFGARSLGEVLRNIPGVRAEYQGGEGNASYSIRGLPLAASGSKFLQFQEDGLPVLEFGDIQLISSDLFMRVDSNLAQIEAIRGGSASTFASNSPGGVINLISKTGEQEGGSVAAGVGLDYDMYRLDFDYGGRISDTLRYHVGGFYRQGEGPRDIGYTAYKGGQFKFNITKELGEGFVRIYGKYLDDRAPSYQPVPVMVTGTNDDPKFRNVANFDISRDSLVSRNINGIPSLDENNNLKVYDARDGMHSVVKSIGLEAKFDVAGWTISEKFRFADISGSVFENLPLAVAPAIGLAMVNGGPGATLSYANGPLAGQAINPATLNGNGLLMQSLFINADLKNLDNMTNDLRASRVWDIGGGKLTTTAGFYKSNQSFDSFWTFTTALQDVVGGGNSALVNVATAGGVPVTQNGILSFSTLGTGAYHRRYDVSYDINAPYASVNYHIGKVAIGASIRYDMGKVQGTLLGSDLGGGRVGIKPYDINGDGTISRAESLTAFLPLTQPGLVDYDYDYLSYSGGINFRVSEPLAVFARYSRGGRAAADRILFTPAINYNSGALIDPKDGYDSVKQTEVGVKYRGDGLALNVTGFLANTGERNLQVNSRPDGSVQVERIVREYRAYGAEFEGSVRRGPFSLTAGATYTNAEITSDATNPAIVGNTPRHQANFIFEATPQYETQMFTVGANFLGTTSSYAQDTNQLKLPGYTVVNAFVQFRPTDRLQLMLNANNLFDTLGMTEVTQASIPASGMVLARSITGRTISGSIRFAL